MRGLRYIIFLLCALFLFPRVHSEIYYESEVPLEEIVVLVEENIAREKIQQQAFVRITPEQIAHLPITNIADLLANLPSIDIRSRGASSAQTDVSMRGGTFDQVAVLLNGIPLHDAQTGHYTLNIPISTELIDHIEVLQGADADITGALTGAINIVTKRHLENDLYSLQMNAGTNGEVNPVFAGSWIRKKNKINFSAEYARSDGYYAPTNDPKEQTALRNTDYQLANVYLQTRWSGYIDTQVGMQYKNAGLGTGYGYASTDQFDATRTMFASVQASIPLAYWTMRANLAYRGQYDRYEWHRGTALNRHWTHNITASMYAEYHFKKAGTISIGTEFRDEFIRSSNMGEHNRWQVSVRAKQHFHFPDLPKLNASISLAGHYNNWCGWYGSGAAYIGYNFYKQGILYASANRSLRMPTWTDMYYHAGVQRGSTDLKAEKAWQIAVGGHYTWDWNDAGCLHISTEVYNRWGTDIIDWTFDTTDSLFYATNRNKVNTFGLELGADYHLNNWLRNVSVQYAYTNLSLDLVTAKSNYLDYLRHKIIVNVDHGIYVWSKGCIGANWSLRWQDRKGTYVDIHGQAGNVFQPVMLLDGCIYVELSHLRVGLECTNITNRHYYDYGGILMPGSIGKITLKTTF